MKTVDPAVQRRCEDKLVLARVVIASSWPYLTRVVMRLQPRWTTEVPTMGVDGHLRLYLNPLYVATLSVPTLALLIAGHEAQHVLGDHEHRLTVFRGDELVTTAGTLSFANACHDLAINSGLQAFVDSANNYRRQVGVDQLPFVIPSDGLFPNKFTGPDLKPLPVGLISEEYADLLRQKAAPQCGKPRSHSCGSGGGDVQQPWEDPSAPDPADPTSGTISAELEVLRGQVAQELVEQETKFRGTTPAAMKRWADSRLAPVKTPWRQLLRRAVSGGLSWTRGRREYSWTQLSRWAPPEILIPSQVDPEPSFAVVIDTSGSMTQQDFDPLFRNLHAILRAVGFKKVPVLTCDAVVHEIQYVTRVEEIKMVGGGGTEMSVGIAKVAEMKKKLAIVMTDLYTTWGPEPKGMKVVIAATREPTKSYPPPAWATTVVCKD